MGTMPNDQFEGYYTEKIWAMIPDVYRYQDGIAARPGVLRSLVEVLAIQAANIRRSQDKLWKDQFIETCDDWAISYIGNLVATRLISALNEPGRRVDVAKTIYYRRRKGTPRILEELIYDISQWDGKLVECFHRLARARHGLDPKPLALAGRITGTLPGGWADLREQQGSELADGPFDEYFHTPDMRKQQGKDGLYGIPKLAFYLFRLVAYHAIEVTPFSKGDKLGFTFDPSGRDIPLFKKRNRPADWDQWHSALEWELAGPIRCRLLGDAVYLISESIILALTASPGLTAPQSAADLTQISNITFRDEAQLKATLLTLSTGAALLAPPIYPAILRNSLIEECGKRQLLPDGLELDEGGPTADTGSIAILLKTTPGNFLTAENCTAANLANWSVSSSDKTVAIDPERSRFLFRAAVNPKNVTATYYYGFSGPIGAGTYTRQDLEANPAVTKTGGGAIAVADIPSNGLLQISDSKTYTPITNTPDVVSLRIQAADLQRPYLVLNSDWVIDAGTNPAAQVLINGVWFGPKGGTAHNIVLKGDFSSVIFRNCTLDPGDATDTNASGKKLLPVKLMVEGTVDKLCIESSITGPITIFGKGEIEQLIICDSIVQSINASVNAIDCKLTGAVIKRSTIFGKIDLDRLQASDVILTDPATVADTQDGCFRFSAAPQGSRLPRPYESFLFSLDTPYWFNSRRFGQPGFAQISEEAPQPLQTGGENGEEMGVFNTLINPIKLEGLQTKIEEYMPFGLIPFFINQT